MLTEVGSEFDDCVFVLYGVAVREGEVDYLSDLWCFDRRVRPELFDGADDLAGLNL